MAYRWFTDASSLGEFMFAECLLLTDQRLESGEECSQIDDGKLYVDRAVFRAKDGLRMRQENLTIRKRQQKIVSLELGK